MFKDYLPQYKQTLNLAIPVVLSQAGQVVVQIVDNVMVGRLGDPDQLAAAAFGNAVFMTGMVFGMGVSQGLTPIVGQLYVQGRHNRASLFFQNSFVLNLMIGLILSCLLMAASGLFGHMGQSERVVELAIPYFTWLVMSVVPFMIFNSFRQFLEGVGNTRIAMGITIFANLLNVLLNYTFIYGNFGAPALGVAGAGLATFISRCTMPLLFIMVFLRKDSYRRYFSFFGSARFSVRRVVELGKIGFPIGGQMFMEMCAFSITCVMMGWIGSVQQAAYQITMSMTHFSFMVITGISAATTIRISHEMGRGDMRAVKLVSKTSFHITIVFMSLVALLLVVLRGSISEMFTPDAAVIHVAMQLFVMVAIFELSDGIQAVALGMLKGVKDVKGPMIIAFVSYIVISLPLGYLMAFPCGLGAHGLLIGLICGLTVAAVLLTYRFKKMTRIY